MDKNQLNSYINELITQREKIKKNMIDLSIYSNGSIRLEDIYNLSINDITNIEKTILEKIKLDKGIKSQQML